MLISPERGKDYTRRFIGLSSMVVKHLPWLKKDLKKLDLDATPPHYLFICFLNAVIWSFLLFSFLFFMLILQDDGLKLTTLLLPTTMAFVCCIGLFVYYPHILVGKIAERVDRNLAFALKDLLLQAGSGVSLFNGMFNVSKAGYDVISDEFGRVVRDINGGMNETDALERMGFRTDSKFIKKTLWRLVNVMRSGASLVGALRGVVDALVSFQQRQIRDFTQELNLWALIYMIFAVIAPTMGTTMMIVLSAFGGAGVSEGLFLGIIFVSFFIQVVIVGFVRNRRPKVNA